MVVANQEGSGTPQNSQYPLQQQQPPPQPQPHQQHEQQQGVYYGQPVGGQPQMYQQPPQYAGSHPGPPPIVVNPPPVQYPYAATTPHATIGAVWSAGHASGNGMWSTGIFDCANDFPNFLISLFCPCITFGQIAEIVDRGATTCGTSGAIYALVMAFTYRTKMRRQYDIPADDAGDFLLHLCCGPAPYLRSTVSSKPVATTSN